MRFVEGDDPARRQIAAYPGEGRDWIGDEHQHIAADDGIEAAAKVMLGRIDGEEADIVVAVRLRPCRRCGHGGRRKVGAEHLARLPDDGGSEEGDVPRAAADVEHRHAGREPGRQEISPGDRIDEPCLNGQALDLEGGMPQNIAGCVHGRSSGPCSPATPFVQCILTLRQSLSPDPAGGATEIIRGKRANAACARPRPRCYAGGIVSAGGLMALPVPGHGAGDPSALQRAEHVRPDD